MIITMRLGIAASDESVKKIVRMCLAAREKEGDVSVEVLERDRVRIFLGGKGVHHIPSYWPMELPVVEGVSLELSDYPRLNVETPENFKKRLGMQAALNSA